MKRMSLIVLPILAVAILTLCHGATADIISGSETVNYKYDATSQGGTWAKTIDAGVYGSPQWLQSFFPGEEWIYIPIWDRRAMWNTYGSRCSGKARPRLSRRLPRCGYLKAP